MNRSGKDTRYYSLDFWRGLACLMVAVFHSTFYVLENPANRFSGSVDRPVFRLFDHFWLGVPLFFVISGYCITAACDATRNKAHPMSQYFVRRFRRIFPPFWIAFGLLFAALLATSWLGIPRLFCDDIHPVHPLKSFSLSQWFGNITLTEIWRSNLFGQQRWFLLGPSWSLGYEEQFYAICGVLLLLSRRWFFRGAVCLTAAVAVVALINLVIKPLPIDGFFFDGRWLLFAAGMLVYYRIHYAGSKNARWAEGILLAGFALALGWKLLAKVSWTEEYYVGFFFSYLLTVLYRWDFAIATNVMLRPVTWCGVMCYSLYLIHWPVIKVTSHLLYDAGVRGSWPTLTVAMPVSILSAVMAGWVFHVFVERRFLNTPPILPWKGRGMSGAGPVSALQAPSALPASAPLK